MEDSRFDAFNCALGDREEQVEMYRCEHLPSSSLLRMRKLHKEVYPYAVNCKSEVVSVIWLDEVAAGLGVEENLLIEIEVQGYEDRVIKGGLRALTTAKLMLMEVSFSEFYAGPMLCDDVYSMPGSKGFAFKGLYVRQAGNPLDECVLCADAVLAKG